MTDILHPTDCECPVCEEQLTRAMTAQAREVLHAAEQRLDLSKRRADLQARIVSRDTTPDIARATIAQIFGFEDTDHARWSDLVAAVRLQRRRVADLERRWADSQHHLGTVAEMLHAGDVDGARSHLREVLSPEWSGADAPAPGDASASTPAGDASVSRAPAGGSPVEHPVTCTCPCCASTTAERLGVREAAETRASTSALKRRRHRLVCRLEFLQARIEQRRPYDSTFDIAEASALTTAIELFGAELVRREAGRG